MHTIREQDLSPVCDSSRSNHGILSAERRVRPRRKRLYSEPATVESPGTDPSCIGDASDILDMSSQRSRAPRGGARAGTHETGEEAQLWNDTQEKLVKLEKNEARAKELRKEIFDKEASLKVQEDAGTSKSRNSEG